jgi:hypothetical protein
MAVVGLLGVRLLVCHHVRRVEAGGVLLEAVNAAVKCCVSVDHSR